jgi:ABC-2 type transport system permease protein
VVLLAVVMPVLMTVVVAAVFGNLLQSEPRLGVHSPDGAVAAQLAADGVAVADYSDEGSLRADVAAHNVDAALILPAGFARSVTAGGPVEVTYLVSGDALASDRAVLAALVTGYARQVAGDESAVSVTVVTVGGEDFVPLGDRVIPLLVVYSVVVAALFVPAASLLDERVKGTLNAVLATPSSMGEVLVAKGLFAGALAMAMGLVTLAINGALGAQLPGVLLALLLGTVMLVELGLVLGLWARDMNTLYTWIKAGGILVVLPGLLALFPALPQWIAQLAPTYYFLEPIYQLTVGGGGFGDVWFDLVISALIGAALLPLLWWSARVTEARRLGG